jgi:hypothetical protein
LREATAREIIDEIREELIIYSPSPELLQEFEPEIKNLGKFAV